MVEHEEGKTKVLLSQRPRESGLVDPNVQYRLMKSRAAIIVLTVTADMGWNGPLAVHGTGD
jgi:hypothetical protein